MMRSYRTVTRAVALVFGLILLVSLASSCVVAFSFLLPLHHINSSSTSKTTPARHQWTTRSSPLRTPRAVIPILVAGSGSSLPQWQQHVFQKRRAQTTRPTTTTALQAVPVAAVVLPSLPTVALACLIPTSLGFYKYEYAVSYGYGLSVATVAGLVLQSLLRQIGGGSSSITSSTVALASAHAAALVFYGLRLCLYLLYRERFLPRFREMRERIETRRRGDTTRHRLTARLPFVLGCATLYAGMAAPLWVTTTTIASSISTTTALTTSWLLMNISIALTWVGFLVAAWGDFQKSWVKARKGEDTLVKGGLFAWWRHPNYTGEALGWTASFFASVIAAATSWDAKFIMPLAASFFGWVGIVGVLAMATSGLEKRQKEKYGTNPEYEEWIRRSWAGPTLPRR